MKELEEKIKLLGIPRTTEILDVSAFLNQQVDPHLMKAIGDDFAAHYNDYDFDTIVTVESSGIAPAVFASLALDKPLVILKKDERERDDAVFVQQPSYSFTKGNHYYLTTKSDLIQGKKVILIDDFLAQGSVVMNVEALLRKVDTELVAIGICIAKDYQPGFQILSEKGYDVYCQAHITKLDPEKQTIYFG